ncbi:MAG: hypothetical protein ACE5EN_06445 [Nitrospinota bacterium]
MPLTVRNRQTTTLTDIEWRKGIVIGSISGILCGWVLIALNELTGVFVLEESLVFNMMTFAIGGAVFGVVAGGFLALLERKLPFNGTLLKGILVSTGLWIVLRLGGYMLSLNDAERFHADVGQTVQGFAFAVMLGAMLGGLWSREKSGG